MQKNLPQEYYVHFQNFSLDKRALHLSGDRINKELICANERFCQKSAESKLKLP